MKELFFSLSDAERTILWLMGEEVKEMKWEIEVQDLVHISWCNLERE